jgi:hypothetical protein
MPIVEKLGRCVDGVQVTKVNGRVEGVWGRAGVASLSEVVEGESGNRERE